MAWWTSSPTLPERGSENGMIWPSRKACAGEIATTHACGKRWDGSLRSHWKTGSPSPTGGSRKNCVPPTACRPPRQNTPLPPTDRARANVLGVGISALNMQTAVSAIDAALSSGQKGYVCVTGVHGVMETQRDESLKAILNNSFLTTPDGMPTVWVGRWQGFGGMERVYGPDLMLEICHLSLAKGYTHFLYGCKPGVAQRLQGELQREFPGIRILGTYCPRFGS